MWSAVVPNDPEDQTAPPSRSKHSATLVGDNLYLLGGRNGNLPMKDFWKFNLVTGTWSLLKYNGDQLPLLQEHTAVVYENCIYVFGGEIGFSAGGETPLWCYDLSKNLWRKIRTRKGVATPKGRRGHSALIHKGNMLIYGGYQDLRGSCSELWNFHFETESWHYLSKSTLDNIPPPRHKHSAVIFDEAMWVYGGMTDLQERSDLWRWDLNLRIWTNVKTKINPGPLHSHAVCTINSSMVLFGGERNGHPTNEIWRFSFSVGTWEKIVINGTKPQPRSESIAFTAPEQIFHSPNEPRVRPLSGLGRNGRYFPNNRVVPVEKTYIFEPSQGNYVDGSNPEDKCSKGVLQEIRKLKTKCSYTVLTSATDSTESLLKQAEKVDEEREEAPTPTKMIKSRSAYVIEENKMPHEPYSVPNIASLSKSTLTPVEIAKLVYLDADEEHEILNSGYENNHFLQVKSDFSMRKGESYSSHLGYADNPLYEHMMSTTKKVLVRENVSTTSDYSSIETVNHFSLSSNCNLKSATIKKSNNEESVDNEGLFGFCNPNYIGPVRTEPKKKEYVELQEFSKTVHYHKEPDEDDLTYVRKEPRAHSASRVEQKKTVVTFDSEDPPHRVLMPMNIYIIGGKERGQVTVFKRPISMWKLKLV